MAKKIKGITIEIGGDTRPLNKALEDVNKKSRDLRSELRQVERLLKLDPSNTTLVAQKQQLLGEAVENTKGKLETLREAERQVQQQFQEGKVGEEQYRAIQREVIKTEEELKKLNKQLKEMDWKGITDGLDKFGKKATDVGKGLTKKVTAPIVAIGGAGAKMALDLEHSIKKVSTLADGDILPVSKIEEEVRAISNASGIAQTEIAESIYSALSAGVESEKVLEFVRSGIDLTRAGFTDMETAIDATTTVLNAYGENAYDVGKIHDIFVQTQDKGKISVDELGKSIGRVIPTASSLGVNLDELGASYAILTAKGQNAQLATTNLNAMLGELGKSGSKTDEALKELTGKSFAQLIGEGKNVGEVLGLIDEYAKSNELSLKDMFGSMNAGSAAVTLLSDGIEGYNASLDNMNNATGKTAENAEIMEDGLFKIQKAMTQVKNAVMEFGAVIAPIIEKAAELISNLVERFSNLDDGTKQTIFVIAGLAAAIGPLLIVVGQMSLGLSSIIKLFAPLLSGLGGATGATGGLSAAIGALTGPIGIAIAAIVGITAVIVALWKTNEDFRDGIKRVWENIKQIIDGAIKVIKGIIQAFVGLVTGDWTKFTDGLKQIWEGMWQIIKNIVAGAWNLLKTAFTTLWNNIKNWFSDLAKNAVEWGKGLISGFIDGIKSMIGRVGDAASSVVGTVKDYLGFSSPTKKGEGRFIEDWGQSMIEGFMDGMKKTMPQLQSTLNAMIPNMSQNYIKPQINVALAGGVVGVPQNQVRSPIITQTSAPTREIHLHIGTLIADDFGLKQLERKLNNIRIGESARLGAI